MRKFPIISMSILLIFALMFLPIHGQAIGALGGSGPGVELTVGCNLIFVDIASLPATPAHDALMTGAARISVDENSLNEVDILNTLTCITVDETNLLVAKNNGPPSLLGVERNDYYIITNVTVNPDDNLRIEELSNQPIAFPLKLPTLSSAPNKIC